MGASTIILFLGFLSSAPLDEKKIILKWMCVTYPYCSYSAKQAYVKLYSCVFRLLQTEELLPFVSHLLYHITTRQVWNSSLYLLLLERPALPYSPPPQPLSALYKIRSGLSSSVCPHGTLPSIRSFASSPQTPEGLNRL